MCHEGTGRASGCSVCWDRVEGMRKVEGARSGPILTTLLLGSGPWGGNYPLSSSNTNAIICCCLCCASLVLLSFFLTLPLPPLPGLCCSLQWVGQQRTHRHSADTRGSRQFSSLLCELGPRAGLAAQYKPDIRFTLLVFRVAAGFASSPNLLAAMGESLVRIKIANSVLILECLHCGFVMAV